MKPTVNVLYLPGTNCQAETMRAFARVGAAPRLVFVTDVLAGAARLDDADILCIPGGFAFGDHLGAGAVAGVLLRTRLLAQLQRCRDRPMLCICNGYQIAVRAGLFGPGVALKANACGTFQDVPEQPHLVAADGPGPWLDGLGGRLLRFPCAHGEGRFTYERPGPWRPALAYPDGANPDGSMDGIAGIVSDDGLVLGLMDHPERAQQRPDNLAVFAGGVRAASS